MARSIRATLVLTLVLVLVPALAFVGYTTFRDQREAVREAEAANVRLLNVTASDQAQVIADTRLLLIGLAGRGEVRSAGEACSDLMADIIHDEPRYANLGVADATGRITCSALSTNGSVSAADRAWFQRAVATKGFAVGEHQVGRITGIATLNFGYPLLGGNGEVTHVVFAAVDLAELNSRIARQATIEASVVTLFDGRGTILARHPDPDRWSGHDASQSELVRTVIAQQQGNAKVDGIDGIERFYSFQPLRADGGGAVYVAAGVPESATLAAAYRELTERVLLLSLVGALSVLAVMLISQRVLVRPLERLVGTTRKIQRGDLAARTGLPHDESEIGLLARAVDDATASLQRATNDLLLSEARFRALAEATLEAIVIHQQGKVREVNPAFEAMFGHARDEAVGRDILDLIAPEARAEVARVLGEGRLEYETQVVTKDGRRIDVEIKARYIEFEGARARVASIRDISARKRVSRAEAAQQAAEAATKAKSEFLANMSHEIRTPLNAVIGMTTLLLDTDLDRDQRELALTVRSSGEHLLTIISDILDFSKIEAGKLELARRPVDVRATVEQSLDLVSPLAAGKHLELAYALEDDVPPRILGDAARLRQVLINLLSNAVKFTTEGEVVVTVTSRPLDGGRHELHFAVTDTGIGIPPDRMDRLFQVFSQVDPTATRSHGGTGLGLAISRRLTELMGGRMWAESKEGVGSTFHFTIIAETEGVGEVPPASIGALTGRPVLIVDDSATNRRILSQLVRSWGMDPHPVASSVEALEMVRRGDAYDYALLDHHMPEMDGTTLASEIRRIRGDPIRLVLLSSMGANKEELRGHGAHFDAVLTKPVKASQLFDALASVTDGLGAGGAHPAPTMGERLPLRILVVEDNAVNQRVATLMLKRLGYGADVAANGAEALEAVEEKPYDVVLMDVQMPEMDGLEATRRIRATRPKGTPPRIIALTAHALEGERERCLAAGMDDYISKPLDPERLAVALSRTGGGIE